MCYGVLSVEIVALLLCISHGTHHCIPVSSLSCSRLPPHSSSLAPLCYHVTSASCFMQGLSPLLSLTETLSFFFDSSLLDITSSFSSCPFSMFTVLLPLLGNMSYFGLLAGVGFFMWLFGSAHHLCCHHMVITFCCTSVTALFQLIRKMYAHTLSSPYVLWHVLAPCFFGTSLYFATNTFRYQSDLLNMMIFLRTQALRLQMKMKHKFVRSKIPICTKPNHRCHEWKTYIFCNAARSDSTYCQDAYLFFIISYTNNTQHTCFFSVITQFILHVPQCAEALAQRKRREWLRGAKSVAAHLNQNLFMCLTCKFHVQLFKAFNTTIIYADTYLQLSL